MEQPGTFPGLSPEDARQLRQFVLPVEGPGFTPEKIQEHRNINQFIIRLWKIYQRVQLQLNESINEDDELSFLPAPTTPAVPAVGEFDPITHEIFEGQLIDRLEGPIIPNFVEIKQKYRQLWPIGLNREYLAAKTRYVQQQKLKDKWLERQAASLEADLSTVQPDESTAGADNTQTGDNTQGGDQSEADELEASIRLEEELDKRDANAQEIGRAHV